MSLKSLQAPLEIPEPLLSRFGLQFLSPRQRHWAQRGKTVAFRLLEARVLSAVTGVQGLPCCGDEGPPQHLLMNHKDPECCRLDRFKPPKRGTPRAAGSNPKGLEGWDGLTSLLRGSGSSRASVAQLVADGADGP